MYYVSDHEGDLENPLAGENHWFPWLYRLDWQYIWLNSAVYLNYDCTGVFPFATTLRNNV